MEVCVKIESPPGEAPKMYGRHFDHTDLLMSKVRIQELFTYSILRDKKSVIRNMMIWSSYRLLILGLLARVYPSF